MTFFQAFAVYLLGVLFVYGVLILLVLFVAEWGVSLFDKFVYEPYILPYQRKKELDKYITESFPNGQICMWCGTHNVRKEYGERCSVCKAKFEI